MQRFPWPLRFSIPAILFLLGGLLGLFSVQRAVSLSYLRAEEDASRQAKFSADQTSRLLEYLFRKADVEGADLAISKLGDDSNLVLAILCDENNKILLTTRYELRNRSVTYTSAAKELSIFDQVRQTTSGQVFLSSDRQSIQAIYPVVLQAAPGELRSSRVGILSLEYDLATQKQRADTDALQRSLEASVVLALLCALTWLLFEKILTQRAMRLVKASNNLAQGKLSDRTHLQGSDELAQISAAFDQMAAKVQTSQQELQALAQREELLNRLANQIRNSLELKMILQSALGAIRNLLQVQRCRYLWYRTDTESPHFELIHESLDPDMDHLPAYSPLQEIRILGEAALQHQSLQVNDIATDSRIDAVSQDYLTGLGFKSLLTISLKTQNGKTGLVVCECFHQPRYWSDSEVGLLQAVTDQLAIAIDQAELYTKSNFAATVAQLQARQLEQTLSELRQTQAQLIQTEKMSGLGQMVAGIAHEINNPINFVHGNLSYTHQYLQDLFDLVHLYQKHYPAPNPEIQQHLAAIDFDFLSEDLPKMLSSMQVGTERIRQIILSLRNFSRLDEADMKPVDIHEGIDSTLLILQNRLKATPTHPKIEVVKVYGELPLVECYAGQLNQVFMNILANAIDVLDSCNRQCSIQDIQKHPSCITIRTETLPSNAVVIRIADNGPGMTEDVKKCLFDPFFTTKPVGKGTGLGLSISYQIVVEKHGGALWCESQPGQGTEFWIEIPLQPVHHPSPAPGPLQLNSPKSTVT